ncbi:hypothetical protein Tco_1418057 [Tanacetum coccineum]
MHPFYPSCEIANYSICIFLRVKFSSHDSVVHHSGHDIQRRVEVDVSSFLVGKVSKYSTTVSSVVAPSPLLGSSFWGSSSSHMILMNITSPSSSLEQTNFVLEDWGTYPSDSSIEFSFRTCYVAIEANGSGCGCGLELVSSGLSSSCSTSGYPICFDAVFFTDINYNGVQENFSLKSQRKSTQFVRGREVQNPKLSLYISYLADFKLGVVVFIFDLQFISDEKKLRSSWEVSLDDS